ncbi:MAG: NAD-dependent malic enzyme [Cyanobacteria bacterium]|nr:NAD-dependent malic enzyme [Cyanobacteriota bacterium]MDA1019938.1 NAD-dependent malic enzyme [Cyanobacteriota bacterium]
MKTMQKQGLRGADLLDNRKYNKSTAFTAQEREELGLRGLLPAKVCDADVQAGRILRTLANKHTDMERYIFLVALLERNERLFYQIVTNNIELTMPIIYTPTVGQACKEFAQNFRKSRGFYINVGDKGDIRKILDNWPHDDVKVIVVTDGQRILGLGDLGSNGMGIPIGKLQLYVAGAGINPDQCLPIMLDVGTNNVEYLNDPLYLGWQEKRLEGDAYLEMVDEFVEAIQDKYPTALIQFEDFTTDNAYRLLDIYKDKCLCFNDDIQGTAAVALAGILAYERASATDLKDMKFMFLGAGAAATGIGDLVVSAMVERGMDEAEARKQLWFIDSQGLVVASRDKLASHKQGFAHDLEAMEFSQALEVLKPNVLIGATGSPGTFTQEIVEQMISFHETPAIFALSNPTSKAECTAEQAYSWSKGKAIFVSGSPFDAVTYEGTKLVPGQGNNAYIFPGIGLGAIACNLSRVTDDMFLVAAQTLANFVNENDLANGTMYPRLNEIRKASLAIAVAIATKAYDKGLAQAPRPDDIEAHIAQLVYDPSY